MSAERRHALYRFFADDGSLLYVGITCDPGVRWKKHAGEKPWWCEVACIRLEVFPGEREVLEAEAAAIRAESPRYNVVHNGAGARVQGRSPAARWYCDKCHEPINDVKDGWVQWRPRPEGSGEMTLVHHPALFGPYRTPSTYSTCAYRNEPRADHHLSAFLGPAGLLRLLELIEENEVRMADGIKMIRRLQVAGYE